MKSKFSFNSSAIPYPNGLSDSLAGPLFLLLGGFLGAGKTNFLRNFAEWLTSRGLKVGLVANDQAGGLVDAGRFQLSDLKSEKLPVESVTGGCFCCKADDLVERLKGMMEEARPDVILAEPVGSCTDLVATVARPLQEIYGLAVRMAPYAVLVDGLGLLRGGFSPDVAYIMAKQLEEADVILVNKMDLISNNQQSEVRRLLAEKFPGKDVRFVSVKTGAGLDEVFSYLAETSRMDRQGEDAITVDYDRYAAGEAMLGWYNAELSVHAVREGFDGNKWLLGLGRTVSKRMGEAVTKLNIAHLKLSLECRASGGSKSAKAEAKDLLAVVQVVSNGVALDFSQQLGQEVLVGKLLINIRAEGQARQIKSAVKQALEADSVQRGIRLVWREEAAFQPGRPVPIHRIA